MQHIATQSILHTIIAIAMMHHAFTLSAQRIVASGAPSKYVLAVDEYVPAPGQFVGVLPAWTEGDNAAVMVDKCTEQLAAGRRGTVTLGAWGGYVTFHFDHSIANIANQRDIYIMGNAIAGGAEPGIVMVSHDTNGNGLPDDEWYELAGSADVDSVGLVDYDYEITYTHRPMADIPWTDNRGQSGIVARNAYHTQDYYPLWMDSTITFAGTLLPPNGHNTSPTGQYWVRDAMRQGYADNAANADSMACSFDIDWAVDANRQPVKLSFIDFVRVYTAVSQLCGRTGETSTEICGAEDLHLQASIDAIHSATGIISLQPAIDVSRRRASRYSIGGQPLLAPRKGLNIVVGADGQVRKEVVR